MKNVKLIIAIIMISSPVFSQNLDGKWLLRSMSYGSGKKSFPGFHLIEIKDKKVVFHTDFSLKKDKAALIFGEGKFLIVTKEIANKFDIVNKNQIKVYIEGTANGKEVIFESNYYRLLPTKTNLNKEEIEKIVYVLEIENKQVEFVFNKELMSEEYLTLLKIEEGEKKRIEQIDSTMFISLFSTGTREVSLPIKEITKDTIILYPFFPLLKEEIRGYRKNKIHQN